MTKIGIIGGGAWGTALAQMQASNGKETILWAREDDVVRAINERHENTPFLPGVPLHENLKATTDLNAAAQADILLLVPPAQYLRSTLTALKDHLRPGTTLVICCKGIEIETGLLMSQIADDVLKGAKIAVLTGPTFAAEIARGLPSAVTLAMKNLSDAELLADDLSSRTLRIYASDDLIGAQVGAAVKNVIAIACGVIEGKKLGDSARAALVTRGLAEISRLAAAMGAKKETLMGMCGVGDMILTCSSMQSRNFSLGAALGAGKTLEEILGSRTSVTEGVYTAKAISVIARNNAVEMPISEAMNECLSNGVPIDTLIDRMLARPVKKETV